MRTVTTATMVWLLVGCGPNLRESCEAYIAAEAACLGGGDTGFDYGYGNTQTCDLVDGLTKGSGARRRLAKTYECQAEVFRAADCSSADGQSNATIASIAQCL